MLQNKARKADIIFQRCCIPSICPLFVSTLSPAVLEPLTDRAVLLLPLLLPLLLHPVCYSSRLCSNKCLVCHSSLLQRIRFILPLSHTLPPSFCPPPSFVHLHSVTHEKTLWEPEYKWEVLIKDVIVLLDDFF